MILRPRLLVVDDIVGSDVDPRASEYRRVYCERLGLLDSSGRSGRAPSRQLVAEASFCSGQVMSGEKLVNSLETVELAFRSGWPSEDGRYWSAVLVDMKFGSDERFGLEVIRAVRRLAREVPIIVVSSLNQLDTQVGETLRRAAERLGAQDFLAAPGASADVDPAYHSTPENLRKRLDEIGLLPDPEQIVVGTSLAICRSLLALRQNVPPDSVGQALLLGESGSGKTHLARYVHRYLAQRSGRSTAQVAFRTVVLSQKSEDMQKVLLFGTDGSTGRRPGPGVFEEASNRGLVFLDELGNLSATAQGDLLGVLQIQRDSDGRPFRSFTRDSPQLRESRCFVLAATNRSWSDLQKDLGQALLMRLEPARVVIPSLRDRKEDVPRLLDAFLRAACARHEVQIPEVDVPAADWEEYADGHSVRQLHDLLENAIKKNPYKSLLTQDDFFGLARTVSESSSTDRPSNGQETSADLLSSLAAPLPSRQSISALVQAIESWAPEPSMPIEEFESAFSRIDVAIARAKLRTWRDLANRQKIVTGSLNLLSTVKKLLGREDIPNSKPGDLANQVFGDAAVTEQPDDPVLSEIWSRRRKNKRIGTD